VVTAVFGNPGLTLLIAIISLQSLVLLTTGTVIVEADLARASSAWRAVGTTARRALVHPVVLPILLGLVTTLPGCASPAPWTTCSPRWARRWSRSAWSRSA
jgi:malonate transporter and related proteins